MFQGSGVISDLREIKYLINIRARTMVCVAKNSKSREATSKGERTGHVNPAVRERDVGLSQSDDDVFFFAGSLPRDVQTLMMLLARLEQLAVMWQQVAS